MKYKKVLANACVLSLVLCLIVGSMAFSIMAATEYEYVESQFFNESSQQIWDLCKLEGADTTVTAGITDPTHKPAGVASSIKLHSAGTASYPAVYFWNEKNTGGRIPHGNLFGTSKAIEYEGIRIWLQTDSTNFYSKIMIYIGDMYTGYWPSSFYQYMYIVPEGGQNGYIDIPFASFVNGSGVALPVGDVLDFITIKLNDSAKKVETDVYIADLKLYRESDVTTTSTTTTTATTTTASAATTTDTTTSSALDATTTTTANTTTTDPQDKYEYLKSDLFNNATQEMWDKVKYEGTNTKVTAGITDSAHKPTGVASSFMYHTAGTTNYPGTYFWEEKAGGTRAPFGSLFGTANVADYEGIRLWLQTADSNQYKKIIICIGTMSGNSYWPSSTTGFYTYTLTIPDGGLDGYFNIPFYLFTNNLDESIPVGDTLHFVAFKYSDSSMRVSDTYFADLQLYREKGNLPDDNNDDTDTEEPIIYEYLRSELFNDSTQGMWDKSKYEGEGNIVTAGITDAAHKPAGVDSSFKFHTTGSSFYPGVYFWEEKAGGQRAPFGNLFGTAKVSEYDGIRLWIQTADNNAFNK
ncbi:MAG: hypothetical protein PHH84_03055 [Oscillospiraceae bacterium]|nr:hypothetical protein [Oscillospiraceae bacterium]